MKIYQIDSSARKKGSTSRALAKKLLDKKFLEDALMTSIAGISAAMKNTG